MAPAARGDISQDLKDLFNTKYANTVFELPEAPGNPTIEWQQGSGNLQAWIDIVGYHNLTREDGINYTFGDPAKEAIIQYGTRSILDCNYGSCSVNSITPSITTTINNNMTVVQLHTVMKWTMIYCYGSSCQTIHHTEEADFYDTEEAPERFIPPGNQSVTLKIYNGNVYKPQVLNFNLSPGITAINITTNNGSIKQYLRAGQVAYTAKNISYLNLTLTDHYEQSGRDISKLNNEFILNSNLSSIEFFTAYGKLDARANITKIQMPETNIKSGVFGLIYMVLVFFGGLYVMGRSVL